MSDHQAAEAEIAEELLSGGNMGGATRVGHSVRRPAGPWTPTIQRFMNHLQEQGLTWAPKPLGLDERGRDSLSYLPGVVPQYPLPEWIWHDDVLVAAAGFMAQMHHAAAGFDAPDAIWQVPVHEPVEVICHNDFAPYNMVFTDQRLSGVIDWDTASPGPRVWDLAYLAYRLVPLTDPANTDGLGSNLAERARRLRLLCDAYGPHVPRADVPAVAVRRLEDLAAFTQARADDGNEHLRDHVALYHRDARWIGAHTEELTGA